MTDDTNRIREELEKKYGGRTGFVFNVLQHLALTGQPCDICTYSGKRYLDAKIRGEFIYALMYGAGPKKLTEMLNHIEIMLSDGSHAEVLFPDIWVINPMPKEGFTKAQLAEVDMSEGEAVAGPNGETIREMIKQSYKPKDDEEYDYFLRRYIAS